MQRLPTLEQNRSSLDVLHGEVLASQKRRAVVDAALRLGRRISWDYQPLSEASQQYVRNT